MSGGLVDTESFFSSWIAETAFISALEYLQPFSFITNGVHVDAMNSNSNHASSTANRENVQSTSVILSRGSITRSVFFPPVTQWPSASNGTAAMRYLDLESEIGGKFALLGAQ